MATHRTDTHAQTVHRNGTRARETVTQTQNLVGLGTALPFFLRLAVAQILVDPRNQVAAQRHAELLGLVSRQCVLLGQHLAVDFENRRVRVVEQRLDFGVDRAELREQFAHVLRTATRGRLIRHRRQPINQTMLEQTTQAHQHAADRTVAADEVLGALGQRILDHIEIDRIEHDDGIVLHAQRRGRVDPVAIPARCAQLRENLCCVVTALAGNDDVAFFSAH